MSWRDYVDRHMVGRTQKELADLAGVSQTAVSRWRSGTQGADARAAMDLARGVGDAPIAALVAAGFLTAAEAKERPAARPSLDQLTDDELLDEIRKRLSYAAAMTQARGSRAEEDDATQLGRIDYEQGVSGATDVAPGVRPPQGRGAR